jgi:gliding motility-associated-like protein
VGTEVAFNAAGSTVDNTAIPIYAWTFGDAGTGTGVSVTHTYLAAQPSISVTLTISYTGVSGCSHVSTPPPFAVNSAAAPTITVGPDPLITEICPDGSETMQLSVIGAFNTFIWNTGSTTASIQVTEPDTYTVITTDANGCIGNAQTILTEKPGCEEGAEGDSYTIPKVFTPNGDLSNDMWIIVPSVQECTMNIFDGRGRRIFETKNFPDSGWDGFANGKLVPDGTYYYVLACPSAKPVTGSVLIVR